MKQFLAKHVASVTDKHATGSMFVSCPLCGVSFHKKLVESHAAQCDPDVEATHVNSAIPTSLCSDEGQRTEMTSQHGTSRDRPVDVGNTENETETMAESTNKRVRQQAGTENDHDKDTDVSVDILARISTVWCSETKHVAPAKAPPLAVLYPC